MVLVAAAQTTIAAARRTLARRLATAGLGTPDLDARILVGHALGLDRGALAVAADRALDADEIRAVDQLAARRLAGEPVARIIGTKEFWGLSLRLSAATLVPRPETETVVETALAALDQEGPRTRPLLIADLGTGSGALLLALLSEVRGARGVGTDVSEAALATARDNATRLGLSPRAAFVACDFGASLAGGFDLIVANPPYIPSEDIAALAPEVRDHDPRAALDGGADGLAAYRAIAADAARLLAPNGHLVVELGAGAAAAVSRAFGGSGLRFAGPPRRDLAGMERALHLVRAG